MLRYILLPCLALLFLPPASVSSRAGAPEVVVSIKPLHSLVSGVMEGVGTPDLLMTGNASPHTFALKPSDARRLDRATVVFWIGPGLETVLGPALAALAGKARVVSLVDQPGLQLHKVRTGSLWADHSDHGHSHGHAHGVKRKSDTSSIDHHLWLDPVNAKVLISIITATLAEADPANGQIYRTNGARQAASIDVLMRAMEERLDSLRDRPFIVFHDAFQYLEIRFGLKALGAIAISPERQPGPRQLTRLRNQIRSRKATCVFSEPQFPSQIAATLVEATNARAGVLDPLGVDIPAGPAQYRTLLLANADALRTCLAPPA